MRRPGVTRMEGVDAGYLYMETPAMHMHTLKVAVLEPTAGLDHERMVTGVQDRLRQLPPLRRRAVPVPYMLNHPVWVTEPHIDPARHFFLHQVPGDGSMRDLEGLIGRIASSPLARDVPLWELHLCEGLEGGRVAIVGKIHHSLADGVAANALLANVTDVRTADGPLPPPEPEDHAAAPPTPRQLVLEALWDAFVQLALLPSLLLRTFRGVREALRYRRHVSSGVPLPVVHAPRTSFNGPLTPRRSFATVTLPLDACRRIRRQHDGVTLNDVVLAVVSGALRRWLAAHGESPRRSLTAGVPVGIDATVAEPRLIGNRVSNVFTTLATDVDDPIERLQTIARVSHHAKQIQQRLGPTMLTEWTQFTPPAPMGAALRVYSRYRAARLHPAPFSVIVSNVPGPREPVTIDGALLADLFSVGPLIEGIGLNVTVWSYVERMNFSLLACPDLLPDVEVLASYFPAALAELTLEAPPGNRIEFPSGPNGPGDADERESA